MVLTFCLAMLLSTATAMIVVQTVGTVLAVGINTRVQSNDDRYRCFFMDIVYTLSKPDFKL